MDAMTAAFADASIDHERVWQQSMAGGPAGPMGSDSAAVNAYLHEFINSLREQRPMAQARMHALHVYMHVRALCIAVLCSCVLMLVCTGVHGAGGHAAGGCVGCGPAEDAPSRDSARTPVCVRARAGAHVGAGLILSSLKYRLSW